MAHLLFLWHGLALLSGLAVMGQLSGCVPIKQSKGFSYFMAIYMLISCFLMLAIMVLYIQVNVPHISISDRIFISAIPLFIASLNLLIPLHFSATNQIELKKHQKILAIGQALFGVSIAVLPWFETAHLVLPSIAMSIVTLIATLTFCQRATANLKLEKNSPQKKLSALMAVHSIALPVSEALIFSNSIQSSGLTFSLPLIYIINNTLIWRYRFVLFNQKVKRLCLNNLLN